MRKMKKSKKTVALRRKAERRHFLNKLKDPDYDKPIDMEELAKQILEEVEAERKKEEERRKGPWGITLEDLQNEYNIKCKTISMESGWTPIPP